MKVPHRASFRGSPAIPLQRLPDPLPSSSAARAIMRGNRSTDTTPELALRRALHSRGLRYRVHAAVVPGLRCKPDIVFTRAGVAVFVDGCFWHRCPIHATSPAANAEYWQQKFDRNVERDRANDEALRVTGWTVVRIWEHEDPIAAADRVQAALRPSAGRPRSAAARLST